MQTVFVTHGGGPMPLLGESNHLPLIKHLQTVRSQVKPPKAILMVTAHWEAPVPTVSTAEAPGMLYDYGGFPEDAYKFKYNAPGDPAVARRALQLLRAAGIPCAEDTKRGYDHGTFVPLMLMFPDAEVPVVQMSLVDTLDPSTHLAIGRALAPLRAEGVLIVASGSSFHNMRVFRDTLMGGGAGARRPGAPPPGQDFDDWLYDAVALSAGEAREGKLRAWEQAPGARLAHPREEHLLPLMVAAGAAGDAPGHAVFRGSLGVLPVSGFIFGDVEGGGER